MLIFQNPGLIDLRAITTIGVNVKDNDHAIGYYGSGGKYAIASILRWGGSITIHRGLDAFTFTAKRCDVRGKQFSVVCMNDVELGFVTDYGKKWEPWQVYRELWTNARDEGGDVRADVTFDVCELRADHTIIVVDCPQLDLAHRFRDQFILTGTPDFSCDAVDLFFRESTGIFYQNLKISAPRLPTLFTYNIKDSVDLTEDRTMKYAHQFDWTCQKATEALCEANTPQSLNIAAKIMLAPESRFEQQVIFGLSNEPTSDAFYTLAEKLLKHNALALNNSIKQLLSRRKPLFDVIETFEPTAFQHEVLRIAIDFSHALGFPVDDYPIVCITRLGDNVLGLAKNSTIYITQQAFELGTKMVASVLIEEFIHNRHGVLDCTRAMQELLFNRLLTLGAEHVYKKPL